MRKAVARLEALRSEAERLGRAAGSLGDYLDRGHPGADEATRAMADMHRYQREYEEALSDLSAALILVRAEEPEAVAEWVAWHRAWCQRVIAEGTPPSVPNEPISTQAVRLYVAKETMGLWEQVLHGQRDYVSINEYFMGDYSMAADAWLAEGAASSADAGN